MPVVYDWLSGEPSITELLADPIAHLVMRRDGLRTEDVLAVVEKAKLTLGSAAESCPDANAA